MTLDNYMFCLLSEMHLLITETVPFLKSKVHKLVCIAITVKEIAIASGQGSNSYVTFYHCVISSTMKSFNSNLMTLAYNLKKR